MSYWTCEGSYEALRDTLLEFFILTKSTHIKSFTCYGWISGFVYVVHKMFKIPLEPHTNCIF